MMIGSFRGEGARRWRALHARVARGNPGMRRAMNGICRLGGASLAAALRAACIAATPTMLTVAQTADATEAGAAHPYAAPVAEAAHRFGIPEVWIWRVMHAESRGNPRAVSRAGAMGLMQIMPATWTMLSARHRLGSDPFDARANLLAGAAYLRAMWDRYRDVPLMLAAYNAGPGRADAYAAGRRRLPAETVAYVAVIAPSLGAKAAMSPSRARAPDMPNWRGAAIFTERPSRPEAVAEAAAPGPGIDVPAMPFRAITRLPAPIFVPLSARRE